MELPIEMEYAVYSDMEKELQIFPHTQEATGRISCSAVFRYFPPPTQPDDFKSSDAFEKDL